MEKPNIKQSNTGGVEYLYSFDGKMFYTDPSDIEENFEKSGTYEIYQGESCEFCSRGVKNIAKVKAKVDIENCDVEILG